MEIFFILKKILYIYTKTIIWLYTPFILLFILDFLQLKNTIKNTKTCTYETKKNTIIKTDLPILYYINQIYTNILLLSIYNYYTLKPNIKIIYTISKRLIKSFILAYFGLSILSYNLLKHVILKKPDNIKSIFITMLFKISFDLKIYKINDKIYFNPLPDTIKNILKSLPDNTKFQIKTLLKSYHSNDFPLIKNNLNLIKTTTIPHVHLSINNLTYNNSPTYITSYNKAIINNNYNKIPTINQLKIYKDSTALPVLKSNITYTWPSNIEISNQTIIFAMSHGYNTNLIHPDFKSYHIEYIKTYDLLYKSLPNNISDLNKKIIISQILENPYEALSHII